ncbi:ribonuclease III [Myxococcota bacterium]|nr:ribonuclease III [Myxococcota bacterium]
MQPPQPTRLPLDPSDSSLERTPHTSSPTSPQPPSPKKQKRSRTQSAHATATTNSAEIEDILQYRFRDPRWLQQALTHRSFCHEDHQKPVPSYERLEFLGDAVLQLAISSALWEHDPSMPEGGLTAFRASLVKRETLAAIARKHELGRFLRLGRGEQRRGGALRESILADSVESLLGAIYVDGGFTEALRVCNRLFAESLAELDSSKLTLYKNQLQEWAAYQQLPAPQYCFLRMEGPEHTPTFFMEAVIEPDYRATGQGSTKKDASQHAAQLLLAQLQQDPATTPSPTNTVPAPTSLPKESSPPPHTKSKPSPSLQSRPPKTTTPPRSRPPSPKPRTPAQKTSFQHTPKTSVPKQRPSRKHK